MSGRWFINSRNIAIFFCGLILTAVFYIRYGIITKPLVFVGVILSFSILYSVLFNSRDTYISNETKEGNYESGKCGSIDAIVNRINRSVKSIKLKSRDKAKFMVVSKFMGEMDEFEGVVPQLVEDYKNGVGFVRKNSTLKDEIREIEFKINNAKGSAREIYEKTSKEKLAAMQEIENIKTSLEESESKLHYILSTLQKVEAILEASELDEGLSDEDSSNLNTHLETFSESLKDVIGSMKL